jgi:hypothetical protein
MKLLVLCSIQVNRRLVESTAARSGAEAENRDGGRGE